jgi:hypothetical protein
MSTLTQLYDSIASAGLLKMPKAVSAQGFRWIEESENGSDRHDQ